MSEIFRFPKERVSKGDIFRCRKCRVYLFSFENLSLFHKKIEPVDQCSAWYINSNIIDGDGRGVLVWVKEAIDKSQWTEGKLYCPKCTSRIGSFNFTQGVRCSCFAFIIPAVWIQKCKVDQISTTDSKPNIRVPENPDNTDDSRDTHGGSPMYYMDASQTGSQSGQSSSESGPSGSSETGSQSGQSCSDSGPSGSSVTGSQSGQSCSESGPSGSSETGLHTGKLNCVSEHETPPESLNQQDTQYQTDSEKTRCSECFLSLKQYPHITSAQRSISGVSSYSSINPQKDIRDHLDGTTHTNYSQKSLTYLNYKDEFGSCRIHRRRNKQLNAEITEDRSQDSCSINENIDRLLEADGSRFELLKEMEQDQELKEILETTANFKVEQQQEHQPNEAEEIPEHLTCPVCLDLLYEPLFCPCDHVFCDTCLRLLNSKSRHRVPRCPLCRKSLHYVYPAVGLREEIKMSHPAMYKERHKAERRAAHRRLPLPNGRMKPRQKRTNRFPDVPMPYSVLVVLGCVLACCGLCLVILFVFCPPTRNRCITIMGYEWMNG